MAPESERAKVECPVHGSLSVQRRVKIQAEGKPLPCTCEVAGEEVEVGRGAQQTKSSTSNESPATCSEVVERLQREAFIQRMGEGNLGYLDSAKAAAILDEWREQIRKGAK